VLRGLRLARFLTLVLVAAFIGGCAGSDGEQAAQTQDGQATTDNRATTTGEDAAPSKEEFIAEGDAICAQIQTEAAELRRRAEELQAQSDELPETEFLDRAASFWDDQIQVLESFRSDLAELGIPPGDDEQVEELLESIDDGTEVAHEIEATLEDGQEVSESKVQEYSETVARGNALAQSYGFEVCGRT
jgi:hypothetical protein